MEARLFSLERRFCCARSSISPQMRSGVVTSRSSVRPTTPSVEFSAGTTVNWAPPDSQRRNASATAGHEPPVPRGHRQRLDRGAEVLAQRLLAERALRPEVGHANRFLEAAAGRDDLAEDRAHFFAEET